MFLLFSNLKNGSHSLYLKTVRKERDTEREKERETETPKEREREREWRPCVSDVTQTLWGGVPAGWFQCDRQ